MNEDSFKFLVLALSDIAGSNPFGPALLRGRGNMRVEWGGRRGDLDSALHRARVREGRARSDVCVCLQPYLEKRNCIALVAVPRSPRTSSEVCGTVCWAIVQQPKAPKR